MRVSSDEGDFVEIEPADAADPRGDLRLVVRVKRGSFSGVVETWVEQRCWFGFTHDLTVLEERRQDEARLESMSPGELSLVVRSLDKTGHMGVEGLVGQRSFDGEIALRFSVFEFDPSELVVLAAAARRLSEQAG